MKNKKRLLANIGGLLVVCAVIAYIGNRPGHIPPYDANLVRIVETERQGYCAGVVGWQTGLEGDADRAAECRGLHPEKSGEVSYRAAARGFCEAIVEEGWEGWVEQCLGILADELLWPTYDGSITDQWNRARPYPNSALSGANDKTDDSRTGGRSGGSRTTDPGRQYYP
jgi:hypothetical protein